MIKKKERITENTKTPIVIKIFSMEINATTAKKIEIKIKIGVYFFIYLSSKNVFLKELDTSSNSNKATALLGNLL